MDSLNSLDQIAQKRRKLQMEQLSYDSDIKRVTRERETIALEVKRNESEIQRLRVTISDAQAKEKKLGQKEQFLQDEIAAIKRKMINLENV